MKGSEVVAADEFEAAGELSEDVGVDVEFPDGDAAFIERKCRGCILFSESSFWATFLL